MSKPRRSREWDSAAYERKLQELIASSKLEKKVVRTDEDFTKSFVR